MFLHNIGPIFLIFVGGPLLEARFLGNLLEKSFLGSKLGNGPLLEHGPLIEILWYIEESKDIISK